MSNSRLVDSTRFTVDAGVHFWEDQEIINFLSNNGLSSGFHMRWHLNHKEVGMPTEPFTIWIYDGNPSSLIKNINFDIKSGGDHMVIDWHGTLVSVTIKLKMKGELSVIFGFYGSPELKNAITEERIIKKSNVENHVVSLIGLNINQSLNGLLVYGSPVDIISISGIFADDIVNSDKWQEFKKVGLPINPTEWMDIGDHSQNQGFVNNLKNPIDAAKDRMKCDIVSIGWKILLKNGTLAPVWEVPDTELLIEELKKTLLNELHEAMRLTPDQQYSYKFERHSDLENNTSSFKVSPLQIISIGVASDPILSLILGFGTTFGFNEINGGSADVDAFFMVTARWKNGLDGRSDPVEYAAIIPGINRISIQSIPKNLSVTRNSFLRPPSVDKNWSSIVTIKWNNILKQVSLPSEWSNNISSFALAKTILQPTPLTTKALMKKRESGGYQSIIYTSSNNEEKGFMNVVDRSLSISSLIGKTKVSYNVATQNIFGLWSEWNSIDFEINQPDLEPMQITYMNLEVPESQFENGNNNSIYTANLIIDFVLDWGIRSPHLIEFVGHPFPAEKRGQESTNVTPTVGFVHALNGIVDQPIKIEFDENAEPIQNPNTQIELKALNKEGTKFVEFGSSEHRNDLRRYRLRIKNIELNFSNTKHIGFVLWARFQERILPNRFSPWTPKPSHTFASDPTPPIVVTEHVQLTSLPDANGRCHVKISWKLNPQSIGYVIYESTETKILVEGSDPQNPQSEPSPNLTLDQRLENLKDAFMRNNSRHNFTRSNSELIKTTSKDITIPRGSTSIHVFVVLGVSAGNIESSWHVSRDDLITVAAPRVMIPLPPILEANVILDNSILPLIYKIKLSVNTRAGSRNDKIQIFRTRIKNAANNVDTMGAPIEEILLRGEDSWTGFDSKPPVESWERIWYRAVVWSLDKDERGEIGGRSPSSPPVSVIMSPLSPPDLSPIIAEWPGDGHQIGDVLVRWTSAVPVDNTSMGDHRLFVNAKISGQLNSDREELLIDLYSDLKSIDIKSPQTGSGVWRNTNPPLGTIEYCAIIRRTNENDAVSIIVSIIDPMGRYTERLLDIPAGSLNPNP